MTMDEGRASRRSGEETVRASIIVVGRVQGVFYRATAMQTAQRLGLTGWVRNLPDGGVEAVAEGGREAVRDFVEWCRMGPPSARVDSLDERWSEATGEFRTFRVTG